VRVTNRPGQQLLGANGRDEGPGVSTFIIHTKFYMHCSTRGLSSVRCSFKVFSVAI